MNDWSIAIGLIGFTKSGSVYTGKYFLRIRDESVAWNCNYVIDQSDQ